MGIGGISMWQLLIILLIVILIFGTKRLKGMGGDLGSAIKSFKKAVTEDEDKDKDSKDGSSKDSASKISSEDGDDKPAENITSKDDARQ